MTPRLLTFVGAGFLAVTLILGSGGQASGAVLLEVDFEDDSGFTTDPDGAQFWGRRNLQDSGPDPEGGGNQSGMIFFGLPNSASSSPTLTLQEVDLTGYTNVELHISLAANEEVFERSQVDGLTIWIGGTILDEFLPDSSSEADLESRYFDEELEEEFEDFVYDISGATGLTSIVIGFRGTSSNEWVAIDSIQIVATGPGPAPIPEPTTAVLFGVGSLVVGAAIRRRRGDS